MSDTYTVTLDVPNTVNVTLRGFARKLDMTKLPTKTLLFLLEKGAQRGANDPLGAQFKEDKPTEAQINSYWSDLTGRWEKGEVAKARAGGLGRTTDPVQREVKRLAKAEVESSITKLLVHHGKGGVPMSRKEFDEKLLTKYVTGQIDRHKERLEREAKANLAKLQKSGEVELLDLDAVDESDDETNETEGEGDNT